LSVLEKVALIAAIAVGLTLVLQMILPLLLNFLHALRAKGAL